MNRPSEYMCSTCKNGGVCKAHQYLGHFGKAKFINEGHNTVLDAAARNALKPSQFAGPDRSYPIPDASHARNALARASQFASPTLKARIRAKVAKRFPGIQQGG